MLNRTQIKGHGPLTPVALVILAGVFIALLLFAYYATNKREVLSKYQTTAQWLAVQANHEASRFMIASERFFNSDDAITRDTLIVRFEILLSRLPLFYQGREADDFFTLEGLVSKIREIEDEITALEPIIFKAERGDTEALKTVRTVMDDASSRLSDVVFDAVQRLPVALRVSFWNNLLFSLYLSIAFAALGLAILVGLIFIQSRRAEQVTDQYRLALKDADAANRSKSRLLANVSHELRTPLNAIIGFSDVLKDQLFGDLGNDRYREYSAYINESGAHLLNLVNDLLNYAKHEADELPLSLEVMPLNELVIDAIRMTSTEAQQKSVKLVLTEGTDVNVVADQRAVRQIATNLIGNAVKYSPAQSAVEIKCFEDGPDRVKIEILDRGPGIPESEVARLLRPFERLHRDSFVADDESGAGLGLALAQALAKKHGGSINLLRREEGGTIASFTLPVSVNTDDRSSTLETDAAIAANGPEVLQKRNVG